MISIHVIASLHNIVDSMLLSSGENFTSSLLSLIMLKLFQSNQRSLLVLILSLFLQLVSYNDSVIELSIIGDTSDVDDTNRSMIFTSDINTSDDNKTITVTNKIDYMTNKRDIFTQVNNHLDDILLWVLSSLLSQVWIYVHVIAILQHSIFDPCLFSSGDISQPSILSSIVYLLFQVGICMHVIAILHNILSSLLPSRVDTCTLSPLSLMVLQPFQPNQFYHGCSFLNQLLGSLLFQEIFESWSFKSLFCNPYLGSRWCVRLQQGVTKIPKQCILILQSLYICREPRVITTQDIMILQSVRLYLTNQRLWGCIICSLIHQVINYLLQMVYASSLCTLLQTVSVSSMYIYVLYCFLQSVYTSSLFTSRLSVINHGLWGCILRFHIHLVIIYYHLQSVSTSSIRTAGHLSCSSISVFQDQTTLSSSKAITVLSLLQQEAYRHEPVFQLLNPASSLLLEPHQSSCCLQDKLQKDEIILALKALFSSSLSLPLNRVSMLLMLSLLVLILLPTTKQEVEQVRSHRFLQLGKHCVQNGIFYIFISILRFGYFYRILHYLWTIGNYNPSSIFITTGIITMIRGVLYSENIVLCSRVLTCCSFSLTSCKSFSRSSQI